MANFNNPTRDNSVIANAPLTATPITWDSGNVWDSGTWDDPGLARYVNPTKDSSTVSNPTRN